MENEIIKVWVTKYALTSGIEEKEVEVASNCDDLIKVIGNDLETYYGEGKEWHKTKESAIKRAEEMRVKKIVSVEKQLSKLKNLKFE